MRLSIVLGVALAVLTCASSARAELRILRDHGGEVIAYVQKYRQVRDSGERVVIDGPCLSACTLLVGIVPSDRVCVTARATLGFHMASYYDDASRALVPTVEGTRHVMELYPPAIRAWIARHGGLKPKPMYLSGRALQKFYRLCR